MLGCIFSREQVILHIKNPWVPRNNQDANWGTARTSSQRHHGQWSWIFPLNGGKLESIILVSYHLKPLRVWDSNLFGKSTYQNPLKMCFFCRFSTPPCQRNLSNYPRFHPKSAYLPLELTQPLEKHFRNDLKIEHFTNESSFWLHLGTQFFLHFGGLWTNGITSDWEIHWSFQGALWIP